MFPELSKMVHDYARPKTRPGWRTLHKYTLNNFNYDIKKLNARLYFIVYYNLIDGGFLPEHNIKNRNGLLSMTENKFIIYEYGVYTYYSYITENLFILKENILYRNTHIINKEIKFQIGYKLALIYFAICFGVTAIYLFDKNLEYFISSIRFCNVS